MEGEGEGEHGGEAGGVGAEEGAEGVEEGEEVDGVACMRWVEGWGEDGGDYEPVDGVGVRGVEGVGEGG